MRRLAMNNDQPLYIVVPMAGLGERFAREGYAQPKPFIEFGGHMMVEHVLKGLQIPGAHYIAVVRPDFELAYADRLAILRRRFGITIVAGYPGSRGAACTALAAHRCVPSSSPVLFADSDSIFDPQDVADLVRSAQERNLDGCLLTVPANSPAYSYVRLDGAGQVTETREKEVISSHAIAGIYYFARMANFVGAAITMLMEADLTSGEFYMSNVYNHLLRRGARVGIHEISSDNFTCVGTPKQLKDHLA